MSTSVQCTIRLLTHPTAQNQEIYVVIVTVQLHLMIMKTTVFSVATPGSLVGDFDVSEESLAYFLYLEVQGSKFLRIYVLDYTVSHFRELKSYG